MTKLTLLMAISMAGILAILVASFPTSMANAYTCNSSSSTHKVNTQSGVSGSSGSCSSSSSASTGFGNSNLIQGSSSGPNVSQSGIFVGPGVDSGQFTGSGSGIIIQEIGTSGGPPAHSEATTSSSSGGAQSSCSSGSATSVGGTSSSSSSQSRAGSCP